MLFQTVGVTYHFAERFDFGASDGFTCGCMLNLANINRVVVIGGGTAGWCAALEMRRVFAPHIEVRVIDTPEVAIVGVGEGGVLNLVSTLNRHGINHQEFMEETGAVYKLGFSYEQWRTGRSEDIYYHMFPVFTEELQWSHKGYYPLLSGMVNHGIEVSRCMDSVRLSEHNASQDQIKAILQYGRPNFGYSYHFDSYKVAEYLKKIALQRGIVHQSATIKGFIRDDCSGDIRSLVFDEEQLDVDFLIDASGFARLAIGKTLNSDWHSFADFLIMDRAIPFHLRHPKPNPGLVTRAIAMQSGWMWHIPLQHRIGAGYVYSSAHADEQQVLDELERYFGHAIEPLKKLSFTPGYFKKVWQGNVVAVGLASGFVEPLEATSIGQMLAQVEVLGQFITDTHGVISDKTIAYFNQQNAQCWHGIADFLRMHYDSSREDTSLWRDIKRLPRSESYAALKDCWQLRTPRNIDFVSYEMDGWQFFGVPNWLPVGVAMGVIPPEASVPDLLALTPEQKQKVAAYLQQLRQKLEN